MKKYALFFLIWVGMMAPFGVQAQPSLLNQVELKEGNVIYQIPHSWIGFLKKISLMPGIKLRSKILI